MIWKTGKDIQLHQIVKLYDSVGWSTYTSKPLDLLKGITNSSHVITCWNDDRLIGLLRAISDDFSILYIQDILVHPESQRKGIGRGLVKRCLDRYEHVRQKVLLTDNQPQQIAFYESLGFTSVRTLSNTILNAFVRIEGSVLD